MKNRINRGRETIGMKKRFRNGSRTDGRTKEGINEKVPPTQQAMKEGEMIEDQLGKQSREEKEPGNSP